MLSKDFLTKQVPVLKPEDSGSFSLSQMEDYKLKHLPVVSEGKYIFLLSEKDIFLMENVDDPIENISIYAPLVNGKAPVPEVLLVMSKENLTVLPVVSEDGTYIGVITLSILIEKMAEATQAASHGALIAIEINSHDYNLSQLSHLIESNNAKILSLLSYPIEATSKLTVLVRIDLEDASPVLRSLERFNYRVLYYSQREGLADDVMQRRLDELMYYLEM
ncbi:MAG: CBS domain-containing protein [Dysgonamonadaceae bacterium]|jgi:CBS domain-containing protein|nr:CBS domain-containing protein [Dysgonamonadaceae bacterium]